MLHLESLDFVQLHCADTRLLREQLAHLVELNNLLRFFVVLQLRSFLFEHISTFFICSRCHFRPCLRFVQAEEAGC